MAFNLSKFNQTYFNRLNLSSISLTVDFTEDITAECGIAAEFRSTAAIMEKVTASANGQSGILPVVSYEEDISGSAILGITALPVCAISEAVSASGKAAAQYDPPAAFAEIVSSDAEIASILSVMAAIAEKDAPLQTDPAPVELVQEEPVTATKKVVIVCDNGTVNIRVGNDTKYARITAAEGGTVLPYVATAENGWHAVIVGDRVGWVSGKYSKIE